MSLSGTRTPRPVWSAPFDAPTLSYERAQDLAHDTGFFGSTDDPLLETVVDMLDELGRPDAAFDVIQIAGTNGKTSTSRLTAALLAQEGLACALYTSPELVEMRERMEVGGAPVAPEQFARGVAVALEAGRCVNAARERAGERPYRITEFDLLTVAACVVFAEAGVDVAVLEVGLGGRWDATSATHPAATCVTGIGLDHVRILGDTLEAIAAEKAAVIKAGQTCVLGVGTASPVSVEDVLLDRCEQVGVRPVLVRPSNDADVAGEVEAGESRAREGYCHTTFEVTGYPAFLGDDLSCTVTTPRVSYEGLSCAKPLYQAANIACAVTLAENYLGRALDVDAARRAVASCPTPGRFDFMGKDPVQLIDAAHNPQSIRAFLASLEQALAKASPDGQRPMLLCAVLADKDVEGIVKLLSSSFDRVAVTQTASPRALPTHQLAGLFCAQGIEPAVYPDVTSACEALSGESYVAVGSITLAGEVAAWFRGRAPVRDDA